MQFPWCNFDLSELFGLGLALRLFRFLPFTPLVFNFLGSYSRISSWRGWIWEDCLQHSRYHCFCVSRAFLELVSGEAFVVVFWMIDRLTSSTSSCWSSEGDGMFPKKDTPILFPWSWYDFCGTERTVRFPLPPTRRQHTWQIMPSWSETRHSSWSDWMVVAAYLLKNRMNSR